jgi:hypothetical protein
MEIETLGRKLGTFTIDWIYFAFVFFVLGAITLGLSHESLGDNLMQPFALSIIALYYLLMLVLRQMRPRIHLYEEGVFVIDKGKKALFTWHELSHFEGQRHTTYINGIPVFRTGANQFFAGDVPAFRIGAMTNWADALADYCLSRMAEKHIPALEQTIRKGERLQIGLVDVTSEGIGSPKEFYKWGQIKNLRLESNPFQGGTSIKAKIDGKFLDDTLGVLAGVQAYAILGLVDALTGSKYLPTMQGIVVSPYKRIMHSKILWVILVIFLIAIVGGVFGAIAENS